MALISSVWLARHSNLALWRPFSNSLRSTGFAALPFAIGFRQPHHCRSAHGHIECLELRRSTLKPLLTVFFLSAASGAYFMMSYGIVIDSTMITNVVQTDTKEALGFTLIGVC
jgi:lipid A ethanolaminephosphotransferase